MILALFQDWVFSFVKSMKSCTALILVLPLFLCNGVCSHAKGPQSSAVTMSGCKHNVATNHMVGRPHVETYIRAPHLCCLHLLLDDGWIDAWALQVVHNVLCVFDGCQEGCHVIPELLRQFQDIKELYFTFLCSSFDVFPEEHHLIQFILDY